MSVARSVSGFGRVVLLAGAGSLASVLLPGLAQADCGADLSALMQKRLVDVTALNQITKAHGGKLDPTTACPRLRSLAATEGSVVAYMTKNKEWCSLPDELVNRMTQSRARTASIAVKACDFAVKIKKMQQQQAQAQAQGATQQQALKLPTGPL